MRKPLDNTDQILITASLGNIKSIYTKNDNLIVCLAKEAKTMLRTFNILATTSRGNEDEACSELWYLFEQIGNSAPTVNKTGVSGLIAAKTAFDPFQVIKEFRKILHERPYEFRYILRIIPIEKIVRTDLSQIQQTATELGSRIGENETFRITLEKRFTGTPSRDIIDSAAANIERKVDLNKPDKILLIEVIGGLTGMSLIRPGDILSVAKEKML